jgi:hypothetical protein
MDSPNKSFDRLSTLNLAESNHKTFALAVPRFNNRGIYVAKVAHRQAATTFPRIVQHCGTQGCVERGLHAGPYRAGSSQSMTRHQDPK